MAPRTQRQAAASRRNGARSRGPRTAEGKARAALNALAHGAVAHGKVVQPETLAMHHEELQHWMAALEPRSSVERDYVHRLKDLQMRLKRVDIADEEETRRALLVATLAAPEHLRLQAVRRAVSATQVLQRNASQPASLSRSALRIFSAAAAGVVTILDGLLPSPPEGLEELRGLLERLRSGREPAANVMSNVARQADLVLERLVDAMKRAESELLDAESRLTVSVEAKPSPGMKRFAAYRSRLLREMNTTLTVFGQLRALSGRAGEHPPHADERHGPFWTR